jgi:hypothetical protein
LLNNEYSKKEKNKISEKAQETAKLKCCRPDVTATAPETKFNI